jgi:hypothetical protein
MRATLSRHIARGQAAEIPEKQKADSEGRAYCVFLDPQNHVHRNEKNRHGQARPGHDDFGLVQARL